MGQYYSAINVDRWEVLNPWCLGESSKAWELYYSERFQKALFLLLISHPEVRGGGDFDMEPSDVWMGDRLMQKVLGRWAGDRVVIVGDYAEDSDLRVNGIPASVLANVAISIHRYDIVSKVHFPLKRVLKRHGLPMEVSPIVEEAMELIESERERRERTVTLGNFIEFMTSWERIRYLQEFHSEEVTGIDIEEFARKVAQLADRIYSLDGPFPSFGEVRGRYDYFDLRLDPVKNHLRKLIKYVSVNL